MSSITPFLFLALANLLGVFLVIRQKRHAFRTILVANLGGSIVFGIYFSIRVFCCSADPSWFLMPLFIAPLEYWEKFGIAIIALSACVAIWSKKVCK